MLRSSNAIIKRDRKTVNCFNMWGLSLLPALAQFILAQMSGARQHANSRDQGEEYQRTNRWLWFLGEREGEGVKASIQALPSSPFLDE